MKGPKFCPQCAKPIAQREDSGRTRIVCPDKECGFIHYGNPLPVVAAIVEQDGHVFLVRNHGWPETWFGLVSGFLEAGETPQEGVLRELREELHLEGKITRLVGVYPFVERNEVIIAFHVVATGEAKAGEEIAAFKRIPKAKLRPWPMGTGHAVREWLESEGITSPS